MTLRYYALPIIRTTDAHGREYRNPKYLPDLGLNFGMVPMGNIDWCVAVADVTTQQHNSISANSDVMSVPANIESSMNAGAVTTARTFLAAHDIPGAWIATGMTYHYVLKILCAFFLYLTRVRGILGYNVVLVAGWPTIQIQNVSADIRNAMIQASASFNYDYSWVVPTTTLGQIMKSMADDWGEEIIHIGPAEL